MDEHFPAEGCAVFWVSAHRKMNLESLGEWLVEEGAGKEGGGCSLF